MLSWLRRRFFPHGSDHKTPVARARLRFDAMPSVVYVVGDVHGRLDLLTQIEAAIAEDARHVAGERWIVLLGDVIDRGPKSAQVLDRLCGPPPAGITRFCIAGNHEIMMLDALEGRYRMQSWLEFGGFETLVSYGMQPEAIRETPPNSASFRHLIESHIPEEHWDFLRKLPVALELPQAILVHAGMKPNLPLSQHSDEDITLCRKMPSDADHLYDKLVVHGHHIVTEPVARGKEINVDTGAYVSGKLTAARLSITGDVAFLTTSTDAIH